MYLQYYGLEKSPFDLIPDPGVVFMSESHQEALAILRYGIIDRKGFLLLTGDVGTGKTSLLNLLVRSLATRVHVCLLNNPTLSVKDFYFILADRFGLSFRGSKARFLQEFSAFIGKCRQKKERVLLIVDEAHTLPLKLLEEIRLLSNQEFQQSGILSVFLVGQPELNQRLGHERLLPLRQRIGIRFHLSPFSRTETASYIAFRLQRAGSRQPGLFTAEALELIHKVTQGVPRLINIVCDQALLTGFSESRPIIEAETIRACVQELHIPGESELLPLPRQQFFLTRWRTEHPARLLWSGFALLLAGGGIWLWQAEGLGLAAGPARQIQNWLTALGWPL